VIVRYAGGWRGEDAATTLAAPSRMPGAALKPGATVTPPCRGAACDGRTCHPLRTAPDSLVSSIGGLRGKVKVFRYSRSEELWKASGFEVKVGAAGICERRAGFSFAQTHGFFSFRSGQADSLPGPRRALADRSPGGGEKDGGTSTV
jgi:hypothetical protein